MREAFAEAATDTEFNSLVEQVVGPMVRSNDGRVLQKEATVSVSDGRFVPTIAGGIGAHLLSKSVD